MTKTLREILYAVSPFDGIDPADYPDDLQGWGSDHPILAAAIEKLRPKRIVEVGSWKGRSAINMARIVRALGLDCEIVCVDTWLGGAGVVRIDVVEGRVSAALLHLHG